MNNRVSSPKMNLFSAIIIRGSLLLILFVIALGGTSFCDVGGNVIPQIYEVDNFEDTIPWSNYPKYYATGNGSDLQVTRVTDPSNPANNVLKMYWPSYSLPQLWWYTNTWDGAVQSTLLDATYYTHLVFKIRGAAGGEDFHIELQDYAGKKVKEKATYFIPKIETYWQEIWIPLGHFRGNEQNPGIDLKKVKAIAFTFYAKPSGTIYVDNFRFVGCIIDDFNDKVANKNKLLKPTGWSSTDIAGSDQPDGSHKIGWSFWIMNPNNPPPPPYWYTVVDFDSQYSCLNPAYYNYLYFKVKGRDGGEYFRIDFHVSWTFVSLDSRNYVDVTRNWQEVYIPLKHFTDQKGLRREEMKSVAFAFIQEADYNEIYVDDIELRYVRHDPVILEDNRIFYKNYIRGFHIKATDEDGDRLVYRVENLPQGATTDGKDFILWKPTDNGTYPINLYVREDRKDAPTMQKTMTITVKDYTGFVKPRSTGHVKLDSRQLIVNDKPFKMRGVGYQPVPIGQMPDPTEPWYRKTDIFYRDLPIIVAMGANTIRTWGEPSAELLDAAEEDGLKVCAGYWIDYNLDVTNPVQVSEIKDGFKSFVNRLKDHPAILLWAIGNENNYYPNHNKKEWYALANQLAQEAYGMEGASYHPVAIVNGNMHNIADMDMAADDASMNYLDLWGANIYPGYSFGETFTNFAKLSDKPLWVAEYGIDAYHTSTWHYGASGPIVDTGYLDVAAQADWDANMAREIIESGITLGGTIMAYSDEWWKAGEPSVHNPGGFPQGPENGHVLQPDNFANEEYWGLVSITHDGPDADYLDDIALRPVYSRLQDMFVSKIAPGESIQNVIDDPFSSSVILLPEGLYDKDAVIRIRNGKFIRGVGNASRIIIKANILFEESRGSIENVAILYSENGYAEFRDNLSPSGIIINIDAGVTAVNSDIAVKNCIIRPDLEGINAQGSYSPPLAKFGKGIQIWNLYGQSGKNIDIRNNSILNGDTGIYLFSQSFAGSLGGTVRSNIIFGNNYGIVERMHNENPLIKDNVITNSVDGIHITYEDGSLLSERLSNILDNEFLGNVHNVWCDETQTDLISTSH